VLERVDQLVAGMRVPRPAGLVLSTLSRTDDVWRLEYSRAGHLPALLISSAGARLLANPIGMMLGALPGAVFTDTRADLHPGALVVLYTDGLVERRDKDLDADLAALTAAAQDLAGQPPETVCSRLLERLLPPEGHEDDVCVLAFRISPGGAP